jgi:hypothetical protein
VVEVLPALQRASSVQKLNLLAAIRKSRLSWRSDLQSAEKVHTGFVNLYREQKALNKQLNSLYSDITHTYRQPVWAAHCAKVSKPCVLADQVASGLEKQERALSETIRSLLQKLDVFADGVRPLFASQARVLLEWGLPVYVVYQIMADVCFFVDGVFSERECIDAINGLAASIRAVGTARKQAVVGKKSK